MSRDDLIFDMRFRWRESNQNDYGCGKCMLNPEECPKDCDKCGFYDILSEDEWDEICLEEFLKTHPNFGKRVFKKLDALLAEFKENFDKLNDEQKGRYLSNCEYFDELLSYISKK